MKEIDPIEELHQVRKKILAKAGGTPAALMQYLRSLEEESPKKPAKHVTKAPTRKARKQSKTKTVAT